MWNLWCICLDVRTLPFSPTDGFLITPLKVKLLSRGAESNRGTYKPVFFLI